MRTADDVRRDPEVGDVDRDLPYGPAWAVVLAADFPANPEGDADDCAPLVAASNASIAEHLAAVGRLEVAVLDDVATDEQIAEYVALRDALWDQEGSRFVVMPAPVFYGFDADCDPLTPAASAPPSRSPPSDG
jgi:hypothetical protein